MNLIISVEFDHHQKYACMHRTGVQKILRCAWSRKCHSNVYTSFNSQNVNFIFAPDVMTSTEYTDTIQLDEITSVPAQKVVDFYYVLQ